MPTTLRDYLASLPNASGTLDADDKIPALEDGTLVGATAAQLGAGGGGGGLVANRQTASYVLVASDAGKVIEMNVAGANSLTVPASVFTAGTCVEVLRYGNGLTTIVAGGGMTLRSPGGQLNISAQFGAVTIRFISTTEAAVEGRLG